MTSKKTAFTLLIAVFIFGFAAGTVTNKYIFPKKQRSHSPRDRSSHTVNKFTKELNLTESQQIHLKELLATIKVKYDSLRKVAEPSYKAVRDNFKKEFSKILTDEQRIKYEEMNREFSEKMKRRRENTDSDKDQKDKE